MLVHTKTYNLLIKALSRQAAVALIGPHQVGKTTLALAVGHALGALYLDLKVSADRNKLADPALFLSQYQDRLVILDEIRHMPELLPTLRELIDQASRTGAPTGRYLILSSASMDLLQPSSESLAGRMEYVYLNPLHLEEVTAYEENYYNRLWLRGGFPGSYLAHSDQDSLVLRRNFIRRYLERDAPRFGFRIPTATLERFWNMLAHDQGGFLNTSKLGASLALSGPTISKYIRRLAALLLIRPLQPFVTNRARRQVKAPKIYIRDSGLLHASLGITSYQELVSHPIVDSSFAGFVIESLLSALSNQGRASIYNSSGGAEIDLILELPKGLGVWAIDIRHSIIVRPAKSLTYALQIVKPDRCFVVYAGKEHYKIAGNIEVIGLEALLALLQRTIEG
ncbi:MAG: ATP-binding protein [Bacteroidota bacterium]